MIVPVRAYYFTRTDDTLRSIAAQFLQTPTRWKELRALNTASPGVADMEPDTLLPVGTALALPGDPLPWGKPDPVYLWTLAEKFLFTAWGREPTPEEVVPFWRGLTGGTGLEPAAGPRGDLGRPPEALDSMAGPGTATAPPAPAPAAPPAATAPPGFDAPLAPHQEGFPQYHPPTPPPPVTPPPVAPPSFEPPPYQPPGVPTPDLPPPAYQPPPGMDQPLPPFEPPAQAPAAFQPPPAFEPPPAFDPGPGGFGGVPATDLPPPAYQPPPGMDPLLPPFEPAGAPAPQAPSAFEPPPAFEAPVAPPTLEPPPLPPTHQPPRSARSAPSVRAAPSATGTASVRAAPTGRTTDVRPTAHIRPASHIRSHSPASLRHTAGAPRRSPSVRSSPHLRPRSPAAPPGFDPGPQAFDQAPPPFAPPPPLPADFETADITLPGTPFETPPPDDLLDAPPETEAPRMPSFMPSLTGAGTPAPTPEANLVAASSRSLVGTAIGDAMMLWQLTRLRHRTGDDHLAQGPLEESLKHSARVDSLELIENAMRHLRAVTVEQRREKPSVLAVRVGSYGFEVLLNQPATAPEGWQSTASGYVLELQDGIQLDAVAPGPSLCPALVPVGETVEGPLLLNIEEIGCLIVSGPGLPSVNLLNAIVGTLSASPLASGIRIVTVGIDTPVGVMGWDNVEATSFDSPRIDELLNNGETGGSALDVLVVGPGNDLLIQRAGQVASTPGSRLALVGATSSVAARWPWRIHVDETTTAVVHPIACTMAAAQATTPEMTQLLGDTFDPSFDFTPRL